MHFLIQFCQLGKGVLIMRITQAGLFNNVTQSMNQKQVELAKTQEQISSGKRVLTPSDDPTTAATVMNINTKIALNERYGRNLDRADNLLSLQDNTLTSITEGLDRIKTLILRAANDTYNASDRAVVADEISEMAKYLMITGNARSTDGTYIFSGFSQAQPPFQTDSKGHIIYTGTSDSQHIEIAEQTQMKIGLPGSDIFGKQVLAKDDQGNIRTNDLFTSLADTITALKNNDADTLRTRLEDLNVFHSNVVIEHAKVGARMNRIDRQQEWNENLDGDYKIMKSQLEDLDYVEAVTRLKNQSIALQAGQQSFAKISQLSLFDYIR